MDSVSIGTHGLVRALAFKIVVMKTMLALDRQKNVVLPLDLSAEVPRTIAGCCMLLQWRATPYAPRCTDEGHYAERVLDLFPRTTELMQLLEGLRTDAGIRRALAMHNVYGYLTQDRSIGLPS